MNRLFAHDPETYTEPSAFRPERYLGDAPELDPRSFVFGIGRRACPGQMLAENTVWTVAAAMLALLDVQRVKGPDGLQVEVKVEYHGGTTT
jgi:cytochrome P450